jgi:hypothetical protein
MPKTLIAFLICMTVSLSLAAQDNTKNANKAAKSKPAAQPSAAYSPASALKTQFMRESGYRNGRPGYVVAYRKPLACGGKEEIGNLEWLTLAEAKAKTEAERTKGTKPCK